MGIADLFRPRHRHSDPAIRAEAVEDLDQEDVGLLASIAKVDRDEGVRKLAIRKLETPEVLYDVAQEQEGKLRELALKRAANLWMEAEAGDEWLGHFEDSKILATVVREAPTLALAEKALSKIQDNKVLADIARTDKRGGICVAAARAINEVSCLRSVAMDATRKNVGLKALEKIDDSKILEQLVGHAKNKSVRNAARKKLAAQQKDTPKAKAAQSVGVVDESKRASAERSQILREMKKLSQGNEWIESFQAVEELQRRWDVLGGSDEQEKFSEYVEKYASRRVKYGKAAIAEHAKKQAEAVPAPQVDTTQNVVSASEQAVVENVSSPPITAEVQPARKNEEKVDVEELNASKVVAVCEELEALAQTESLKKGDRVLKRSRKVMDGIGPLPTGEKEALLKRFTEARGVLFSRIQELRELEDWKRWANVPLAEKLIAQAEVLATSDEAKNILQTVRTLQREWKGLGPIPRKKNDELWGKFKELCDKAYEKGKTQQAQEKEERLANYEKKLELVRRAEELSESEEWDETARELKELQKQYKEVGPVPRKHSNTLWNRFREACDTFFEGRRPHLEDDLQKQQENLEAKEALCASAEKWSESDDFEEASNEFASLRDEWRNIGHVPRDSYEAVSQRFKKAADHFYTRRENARKAQAEKRIQEIEQFRVAIEELKGSLDFGSGPDVASATMELRSSYIKLDLPRDLRLELRPQLVEVFDAAVGRFSGAFEGTDFSQEKTLKRKLKLVEKAEEYSNKLAPEPQADEKAALQAAWEKNALGGLFAGSSPGGRSWGEVLDELHEAWARSGPLLGPEGNELKKRFRASTKILQEQLK